MARTVRMVRGTGSSVGANHVSESNMVYVLSCTVFRGFHQVDQVVKRVFGEEHAVYESFPSLVRRSGLFSCRSVNLESRYAQFHCRLFGIFCHSHDRGHDSRRSCPGIGDRCIFDVGRSRLTSHGVAGARSWRKLEPFRFDLHEGSAERPYDGVKIRGCAFLQIRKEPCDPW